jgi:protocatechuate 3,4-dioxygenase beta subunit
MFERPLTRKAWLGGAVATALGLAGLELPRGSDAASLSCILTPEQTEGPYYIAGEKLRRNITDGHPGAPMLLRTTVVDATTCRPIKNAAVDIWHADAAGVYSGFGSGAASRTFMRGIQRTNAKGLAEFRTVYPG